MVGRAVRSEGGEPASATASRRFGARAAARCAQARFPLPGWVEVLGRGLLARPVPARLLAPIPILSRP